MVTAENSRRAPAFRKFAEHRGARGFTFEELATATADRPSLTVVATWLSEACASGYLLERSANGRYRVA
jgi:hypothetical protein